MTGLERQYRRMACAVLLQAIRDLSLPTYAVESRIWIYGPHSVVWAEVAGLGDMWPPSESLLARARREAMFDKSLGEFFFGRGA